MGGNVITVLKSIVNYGLKYFLKNSMFANIVDFHWELEALA